MHPSNHEAVEDESSAISMMQTIADLRKENLFLRNENSTLRCHVMKSGANHFFGGTGICLENGISDLDPLGVHDNDSLPLCSDSLQSVPCKDRVPRNIPKSSKFYETEIRLLSEENEDIYKALEVITLEKEEMRQMMEKVREELDTCKEVIDYLMTHSPVQEQPSSSAGSTSTTHTTTTISTSSNAHSNSRFKEQSRSEKMHGSNKPNMNEDDASIPESGHGTLYSPSQGDTASLTFYLSTPNYPEKNGQASPYLTKDVLNRLSRGSRSRRKKKK